MTSGPVRSSTDATPLILLSANSLWNITHFRAPVVTALAAAGYRLVVAAPVGEADAGGGPFEVEALQLNRSGLNPLDDLRLALAYVGVLRRRRPAAYLGWTIKPNIYGALAARWAGVPAILNVSGLGTAFLGGGLFSWFVGRLYRFAFARAAEVFFQNVDDRDLFVARGLVRTDQARLLPGSGIDLDRFAPTDLPDGPPVFLLIARLLGDKGVREYVAAARQLRVEFPDARFQLLGPLDPDNRTAIARDELATWVAEGAIDYLGTADDVRPFIAAASVVVLPSYREGLPRTLLEGAAMGRPLVATDVPGCRDVVEDGVNGLLCRARDAAALADAMRRMALLDAPTLQCMGQASRAHVEGKFSQDVVSAAYLRALDEVVKSDR